MLRSGVLALLGVLCFAVAMLCTDTGSSVLRLAWFSALVLGGVHSGLAAVEQWFQRERSPMARAPSDRPIGDELNRSSAFAKAVRLLVLALFVIAAALLWFVTGPVQVDSPCPDDECWIVGCPRFYRGPGWESGSFLCLGSRGPLQWGLWASHVLASWLLWRTGFARRVWPFVAGPALLGQALMIAAFAVG
jgi:hypothetical protein